MYSVYTLRNSSAILFPFFLSLFSNFQFIRAVADLLKVLEHTVMRGQVERCPEQNLFSQNTHHFGRAVDIKKQNRKSKSYSPSKMAEKKIWRVPIQLKYKPIYTMKETTIGSQTDQHLVSLSSKTYVFEDKMTKY